MVPKLESTDRLGGPKVERASLKLWEGLSVRKPHRKWPVKVAAVFPSYVLSLTIVTVP